MSSTFSMASYRRCIAPSVHIFDTYWADESGLIRDNSDAVPNADESAVEIPDTMGKIISEKSRIIIT